MLHSPAVSHECWTADANHSAHMEICHPPITVSGIAATLPSVKAVGTVSVYCIYRQPSAAAAAKNGPLMPTRAYSSTIVYIYIPCQILASGQLIEDCIACLESAGLQFAVMYDTPSEPRLGALQLWGCAALCGEAVQGSHAQVHSCL